MKALWKGNITLALVNIPVKLYSATMELIRAKIEGEEVKIPPKREVEKVVSLMEALKKSLEKKAV